MVFHFIIHLRTFQLRVLGIEHGTFCLQSCALPLSAFPLCVMLFELGPWQSHERGELVWRSSQSTGRGRGRAGFTSLLAVKFTGWSRASHDSTASTTTQGCREAKRKRDPCNIVSMDMTCSCKACQVKKTVCHWVWIPVGGVGRGLLLHALLEASWTI